MSDADLKEAAAKELAEVYEKVNAHYWKATRSAVMGTWPSALYRRRAELEQIVYGQIIS